MAPLIDVRHLNKIYNLGEVKVHAVADVTLQIERGSFWPSWDRRARVNQLL